MNEVKERNDESEFSALLCEDGYIKFLIKIGSDVEYKMDFKVYEVTAWGGEGFSEPRDKELYVEGCIKWDGCSHVWFGEKDENDKQDGYLHLCGKGCWENHSKVMDAIYKRAEKTIEKYDAEVAA